MFVYNKFLLIPLQEVSESCAQTIRKSWFVIDEVASKPNGLSILTQRFKTCAYSLFFFFPLRFFLLFKLIRIQFVS